MSKIMRYPPLKLDEMSNRQRQVAEEIGGKTVEGLNGPYLSLIQSPEIANLVHELDQYLRFNLRIPERLQFLAVLVAAGRYRAEDVAPFLNLEPAQSAGLRTDIVESLRMGIRPATLSDDETLVYEFVSELVASGRVSDRTFDRASQSFGREICLEIVKICGFTIFMSNLMNITGNFYPKK